MDLSKYIRNTGFYFHKDTPEAVQRVLIEAHASGKTVRIWFGDAVTGRAWDEEHDVLGTIGRSCGPVKVPLLVARGDIGGGHLLDQCIVRIDAVRSVRVPRDMQSELGGRRTMRLGTTLYAHPSFHAGDWTQRPSREPGYVAEVLRDGSVIARFRTVVKAAAYVSFMTGQAYERP